MHINLFLKVFELTEAQFFCSWSKKLNQEIKIKKYIKQLASISMKMQYWHVNLHMVYGALLSDGLLQIAPPSGF